MEPAEQTQPITLRDALATLVDRGSWKRDALQALPPATWAAWFAARLQGCDPFFPYNRNELPADADLLFRELFSANKDFDTEPAAEGLALYLSSLDPATASGVELKQAMDLVMRVRARDTSARDNLRDILRGWLLDRELLNRADDEAAAMQEPPEVLHRKAMFALIALQQQGDEADRAVWEAWMDDERFALAAFSGMALSVQELPEGMVQNLLNLAGQHDINIRFAIESLFVGERDRQTVSRYLWEEIKDREDPISDWEHLRTLVQRVDSLPSFELARRRYKRLPRNRQQSTPAPLSPWDANYLREEEEGVSA